MQPRVTIIIPTFNRAHLVPRAIDSALRQTHANLDVIVVDDGSTDRTSEVLGAYEWDSRVRVLEHPRNRGVNAAINTGLAQLTDETAFFGLLGSDDVLLSDGVAALLECFDASGSRYSQVLGWCRDMETGAATGQMHHLPEGEGLLTYDDALAGRFTGDFWHLARRDALDEWRFEARARGGGGSIWWPMLRQRPAWLSRTVVLDVDRSGADRLSLARYTRDAATSNMWASHAFLAAVGGDLRVRFPDAYAGELADLAKWAALAGDRRRARAASRQALRTVLSRRTFAMTLLALVPRQLLRWLAESTKDSRLRRGPL